MLATLRHVFQRLQREGRATLYHESWRPQFHFTPKIGWMNDPNGMLFYKGEYHLFFQCDPDRTNNPCGIKLWGHAVSSDMLHWTQLPTAIEPDSLGSIWSGSGVVDWNNTTGFQTGREKPLVCIYTTAGGQAPGSDGKPFTQSIAYSNDRGRTWTKYAKNPVLQARGGRQPRSEGFLARSEQAVDHGAVSRRERLCDCSHRPT